MPSLARAFVFFGLILVAVGLVLHFGVGKNIPLGRLPGDVVVERENFRLYIPITTSVLISLAISLVLCFLRLLGR